MPTEVFRATDATLVLAADDSQSVEGTAAGALITQYDLSNAVGRLSHVRLAVTSDVQPFYEIGRRYPAALRPGLVAVTGSAERAHINGALLRLLLGEGASSPPATPVFAQPAFNAVATLRDVAQPDAYAKVTAFGVRFDSWSYNLGVAGDFVLESVTFQAMRLTYEEA
ncbi:hypothetical protein [Actinopolymorpha pittospori]